jgi:hypothetical protein
MEKFLAEGRLYFPKGGGTPCYIRYFDEMPGVPLQNIQRADKMLTDGGNSG